MDLLKLRTLDLCSGIGGITEGLSDYAETVAYCEREPASQRILLSRMHRGEIARAPIWDDIRTLRGHHLSPIDLITAGFPCQDLSSAGLQVGLGGERSQIFFEVVRLAVETEAPVIFLENVKGISPYIKAIRDVLESFGYQCRDGFLKASDVGAKHPRERWFLVAYSDRFAKRKQHGRGRGKTWPLKNVALDALGERIASDSASFGLEESGRRNEVKPEPLQPFTTELLDGNNGDEYASFLLRMDHGIPNRLDRIRALGNGVVPQQVKAAFEKLVGITAGIWKKQTCEIAV